MPLAVADHSGRGRVVVKCTDKVYINMQAGANDENYEEYLKFA
jgi:hypothetical protein